MLHYFGSTKGVQLEFAVEVFDHMHCPWHAEHTTRVAVWT